jgi:GNAT superfamily N-acetyltransferase
VVGVDEPVVAGDVRIRPMGVADVPVAAELLALPSVADIRRVLVERMGGRAGEPLRHALVAQRDGTIVGAARATRDVLAARAVSVVVGVAPAARRMGIGTALAERLDELAATIPEVDLMVCALRDDLDVGRRFALGRGFAVVGHSVGWRLEVCAVARRSSLLRRRRRPQRPACGCARPTGTPRLRRSCRPGPATVAGTRC